MKVVCPKCGVEIGSEGVNIRSGVAYCATCREAHSLAALLGISPGPTVPAERPARTKVVFTRDGDRAIALVLPRIGLRGIGCFFVLFALFWNAISWTVTGAFLFGSQEGGGPPVALLAIFPLVGLALIGVALWVVFGRTSLAMDRQTLLLRRELFGIKWQRTCNVADIQDVRLEQAYTQNDRPVYGVGVILSGSSRPIVFGSGLGEDEKKWLVWEIRRFWREATGRPAEGGSPATRERPQGGSPD